MRKPRHFSPTSYALWRTNKDQFYERYLSNRRFDKDPQTMPMAIGSAFDFLVKEHLNKSLGAKLGVAGELAATMEKQVEAHNLTEAKVLGEAVMTAYVKSGALDRLKSEIVSDARFEFGITASFDKLGNLIEVGEREEKIDDFLYINGRPDGFFMTRAKMDSKLVPVIHDWKVNGWQSSQKSPDPGYVCCHGVDGTVSAPHKDAFIAFHEGVKVNKSLLVNEEWKTQLSMYSWVLGVPIGVPIIGSIDQIIGPASKPRIARHRFIIDKTFQDILFQNIYNDWNVINSDWIFRDVSQEQSIARCSALENQVVTAPADDFDFERR